MVANLYLFLALDVPDGAAAMELLTRAGPKIKNVKVGLELFIAEGPNFVRSLILQGYTVALDLKIHDIPETVERACSRAAKLGVAFIMAHVSGGRKMLEAAVRGVKGHNTKVLGVTVLTSLKEPDLAEIGTETDSVPDLVVKRALVAQQAGCHGVIASAEEVANIRTVMDDKDKGFLIITPAIRPSGTDHDDQKRVGTARASIAAGSNGIVVGRPIRDAGNPAQVVDALLAEIEEGLQLALRR